MARIGIVEDSSAYDECGSVGQEGSPARKVDWLPIEISLDTANAIAKWSPCYKYHHFVIQN